MASSHNAREFRGNQGEDEDVDVISVEPIAMIVSPELQDSPRTATSESSASSSTGGSSGDHRPSTSSDSPTEETPSGGAEEVGCSAPVMSAAAEVVVFEGWESKVLSGRLDNLCKAPKTLPARLQGCPQRQRSSGRSSCAVCVPPPAVRDESAARPCEAGGLVDLEALVTPDQIALLGFVDVANLHGEGEMSSILERQRQRAQGSRNRGADSAQRPRVEQRVEPAPSSSKRRLREDSDAEDDVPLIRQRTSTGNQPAPAATARPANVPPTPACEVTQPTPASSFVAGPRIAYPDGFNYVRTDCHAAMLQGMQNFVPPADRQRAKGHVQQHGGHAALIKLMDAFSYTIALFDLADEVSCLQSSEMANRAASAESPADELARKVSELREELDRARAEKESGIQAAKEEAGRAEDRAKKVEAEREQTLHELMASANTTTDIFNEVRGRVLRVRADFSIGELAFFEGEEIDNEGKSLALPANTRVRLKWELNEERLPVWPPSVIEEGEDTEGLPSFDAWVADPHDVPAKPSSTPPSALPQLAPAAAPAFSPPDRSSPARSAAAPNDASIPVDLTDD
ncbi:hypothetical protein SLEP1_g34237 [Rubroshorea leprosula]|uniref:Uncharacterized protein n=1 Tax=Rubroshorea leprosula TaxID=152421 RepID=A0AAV5KJE5_9ROSI|nr:hypothetical protein SLEP1_g34237 [Rubroshorea leprosula]